MRPYARITGIACLSILVAGCGILSSDKDEKDRNRDADFGSDWTRLGTARLDDSRDGGRIRVDRDEGRFNELGLQLKGRSAELRNVVVHYNDDTSDRLASRVSLSSRDPIQRFDIPGKKGRHIDSVTFDNDSDSSRSASVTLYGR